MENKMKKLIALIAVTTLASTSAIASIALSGAASVSYDDNGSGASAISSASTLTITGTAGATTVTGAYSMEGASMSTDSLTMATAIGPLTIAADMHDEDSSKAIGVDDGTGDSKVVVADGDDTGITVSLSVPVGDATIATNADGDVTISGTFSGVTITYAVDDDEFTGAASIAGMDVSITNDGGSTTWSIGTTVSGVALTLDSENDISAAFGLSGNTMTVSHVGARAEVAATTTTFSTAAADAYTTVAISRALTSGATLAATYSTSDSSLTLKASVAF
jgi:hypothetical protein